MAENSCTNIQKSLNWCQGRPVMPGIKRRAFILPKTSIAAFPALTRDSLGRPTVAKYANSFTLVEGAKWNVIDHLANKAEFKSETQGEYPSQTFKVTCTLVHPGVNEDAALATSALLNSDNVVIVEDMEGKFRVVGSQYYESTTTVSRDNGQGSTGTAGTTIVIEATDIVDAPFYDGEIVTPEGTINETPDNTNT